MKNANSKEDNTSAAEQPLTTEVRLERRPEKTCRKNPLKKNLGRNHGSSSSDCTVPFLKYKRLKLRLRVFLAGHSVAIVTYCVTKIILTLSSVIGQFFDTMIVASSNKEW